MLEAVSAVNDALAGGEPEHRSRWLEALGQLAGSDTIHGLVGGRATRILLDAGVLPREEATRRAGLALARARSPEGAAAAPLPPQVLL